MKTKELCERFAEAVLANYGRDGELTPAILVMNAEGHQTCQVIPHLTPDNGGMSAALYAIGTTLGVLYDARYLVAISETWVTEGTSESEARKVKRGELEQRAESGDQTVHTGLLVAVYDLDEPQASHAIIYNVDRRYERHDMPGVDQGDIADVIRDLARELPALRAGRPPGDPPVEVAQLCATVLERWVAAILVPDPEASDD